MLLALSGLCVTDAFCGDREQDRELACDVVPQAGDSPLQMGPKVESSGSTNNPFAFLFRLIIGTLAGSYYFLLPIYMWLKNLVWPRNAPGF